MNVRASSSHNPSNGTDKMSFLITPSEATHKHGTLMLSFLTHIEDSMNSSVVTDKGHKHSSGASKVVFFLKPRSAPLAAEVRDEPPHELLPVTYMETMRQELAVVKSALSERRRL